MEIAQLLDAIEKDPDERSNYLVLQDLCLASSDPRGELIALQARLLDDAHDARLRLAERELVRAHAAHLFGEAAPLALGANPMLQVEWFLGFARTLIWDVDADWVWRGAESAPDLIRGFLEHRSARFLRSIEIGHPGAGAKGEAMIAALGDRVRPEVRSLTIGRIFPNDTPIVLGALEPLLTALPGLERLTLRARSMALPKLTMPHLEALEVRSAFVDAHASATDPQLLDEAEVSDTGTYNIETAAQMPGGMGTALEGLLQSQLPALQTMTLDFGRRGISHVSADALSELFQSSAMPSLRSLSLVGCDILDDALPLFVGAPISEKLEALDLRFGDLSELGVVSLTHRAALPALRSLKVDGHALSLDAEEALEDFAAKEKIDLEIRIL